VAHRNFGAEAVVIDFPLAPIVPNDRGEFSAELRFCLPASQVPFAPELGDDPIAFEVSDDLGWRTEPIQPELGRASNALGVNVYDPRD
jgi:hypothetical protein